MHKERIRMRDLIVLLPGIMGSVLEKDGTDLWAAANRTIFSALRKRRRILQWLKLDGDDPEVDDLADGVTATRLISDARIAGFIKIDGYNRVSEMIKGNFDVIQGQVNTATRSHARANYFEFPYDWRRDNSASAQRLSRFLSVRLTEWRKYAGQGAKVILVAHSMGGIVARYYLEALGGWKDCKALITFGTPFRGSVKALDCLVNGCSVGPFDFTELVSSFTSVYQLLPIYEVVNFDGGLHKLTELEIPGLDTKAVQKAQAFHQKINSHISKREKAGDQFPYILSPIVGKYQPTLQSAELFNNELTVSEVLPTKFDKLLDHGDGTVPYLSAVPPDLLHRNTFFAESHGSLHCNNDALDFLYEQLTDLQIEGLEHIRGPERPPGISRRTAISLRAPDFCPTNEDFVMQAKVYDYSKQPIDPDDYDEVVGSLTALIEPIDGNGSPQQVAFAKNGDQCIAKARNLLSGVHRLTVHATRRGPLSPTPVHELFQVSDV